MNVKNLPIEDWSQEGREKYIKKNRISVELTLAQSLEYFKEDVITDAFGSQEKAVVKIIELFVSSRFSLEKVMYKDLKLFTQLKFWVNFKTAGNVTTSSKIVSSEACKHNQEKVMNTDLLCLEKMSNVLPKFNQRVAADVITYWLKANKKLLNELASKEAIDWMSVFSEIENSVSNTQETRYKVDAAFRFLFLYLGVDKQKDIAIFYEKKYLTKGNNKPQYVSMDRETHKNKHLVRLTIKKIIDSFSQIHKTSDDSDILTLSLLKVIAKKAVLDVYEVNSNNPDKNVIEEYSRKLKSFNKHPSFLKEEAL
ncbi:hypothetical protein ESZ36_08580 [Colwellia demingiae]|uniref:Uncharacterized protein n=1 Tax=Colwellia demingiae TaxID=89401 RepID=A0A5C6QIR5_9GAMM|nr:hypothetical protein [Colwellia demingiae]TWX68540.1 hypothetical protein ESZ36_08580 [Colwellia demingiae]